MILIKVCAIVLLSITSLSCQSSSDNHKQLKTLCESDNIKDGIEKNVVVVSGLSMGTELSEVKRTLGEPQKQKSYDNELSNAVHTLLFYGSSKFEFYESKLISFEILSNDIALETFNIGVGENIERCSSLFQFYKEVLPTVEQGESIKLRIPIKGEDEALIFTTDDKGVVPSIYYWVNW